MNVVGQSDSTGLDLDNFQGIDPLQALVSEGELESETLDETSVERLLVSDENFPDQSMYVLDLQLQSLRESLGRLKFYISDLDDMLPR